jgi:hypothetical protein
MSEPCLRSTLYPFARPVDRRSGKGSGAHGGLPTLPSLA